MRVASHRAVPLPVYLPRAKTPAGCRDVFIPRASKRRGDHVGRTQVELAGSDAAFVGRRLISRAHLFNVDEVSRGLPGLKLLQKLVTPVVDVLFALGVRPNYITAASMALCGIWGGLTYLYASSMWPLKFLWVPMVARILLDVMDGRMARRHDLQSGWGKLFNELEYFICDIALYWPLMFVAGMPQPLTTWIVGLSAATEAAGLPGYLVSGRRRDDFPLIAPMIKPVRMGLIAFLTYRLATQGALGSLGVTILWAMAAMMPLTILYRLFKTVTTVGIRRGFADRDEKQALVQEILGEEIQRLTKAGFDVSLLATDVGSGGTTMKTLYRLHESEGIGFGEGEARRLVFQKPNLDPNPNRQGVIQRAVLRDEHPALERHGARWLQVLRWNSDVVKFESGPAIDRLEKTGRQPFNLVVIGEAWEYFSPDRYVDEEALRLFQALPPGATLIFSAMGEGSGRFYNLYVRDRVKPEAKFQDESDSDRDDDANQPAKTRETPRFRYGEIADALRRAGFEHQETARTRRRNFIVGVFTKPKPRTGSS